MDVTHQKGGADPDGSGECSKTGTVLELIQLLLAGLEYEALEWNLPGIKLDCLTKKKKKKKRYALDMWMRFCINICICDDSWLQYELWVAHRSIILVICRSYSLLLHATSRNWEWSGNYRLRLLTIHTYIHTCIQYTLMPFNTSLMSLILESLCDICFTCTILLHETKPKFKGIISTITANPAKMEGPMVR